MANSFTRLFYFRQRKSRKSKTPLVSSVVDRVQSDDSEQLKGDKSLVVMLVPVAENIHDDDPHNNGADHVAAAEISPQDISEAPESEVLVAESTNIDIVPAEDVVEDSRAPFITDVVLGPRTELPELDGPVLSEQSNVVESTDTVIVPTEDESSNGQRVPSATAVVPASDSELPVSLVNDRTLPSTRLGNGQVVQQQQADGKSYNFDSLRPTFNGPIFADDQPADSGNSASRQTRDSIHPVTSSHPIKGTIRPHRASAGSHVSVRNQRARGTSSRHARGNSGRVPWPRLSSARPSSRHIRDNVPPIASSLSPGAVDISKSARQEARPTKTMERKPGRPVVICMDDHEYLVCLKGIIENSSVLFPDFDLKNHSGISVDPFGSVSIGNHRAVAVDSDLWIVRIIAQLCETTKPMPTIPVLPRTPRLRPSPLPESYGILGRPTYENLPEIPSLHSQSSSQSHGIPQWLSSVRTESPLPQAPEELLALIRQGRNLYAPQGPPAQPEEKNVPQGSRVPQRRLGHALGMSPPDDLAPSERYTPVAPSADARRPPLTPPGLSKVSIRQNQEPQNHQVAPVPPEPSALDIPFGPPLAPQGQATAFPEQTQCNRFSHPLLMISPAGYPMPLQDPRPQLDGQPLPVGNISPPDHRKTVRRPRDPLAQRQPNTPAGPAQGTPHLQIVPPSISHTGARAGGNLLMGRPVDREAAVDGLRPVDNRARHSSARAGRNLPPGSRGGPMPHETRQRAPPDGPHPADRRSRRSGARADKGKNVDPGNYGGPMPYETRQRAPDGPHPPDRRPRRSGARADKGKNVDLGNCGGPMLYGRADKGKNVDPGNFGGPMPYGRADKGKNVDPGNYGGPIPYGTKQRAPPNAPRPANRWDPCTTEQEYEDFVSSAGVPPLPPRSVGGGITNPYGAPRIGITSREYFAALRGDKHVYNVVDDDEDEEEDDYCAAEAIQWR